MIEKFIVCLLLIYPLIGPTSANAGQTDGYSSKAAPAPTNDSGADLPTIELNASRSQAPMQSLAGNPAQKGGDPSPALEDSDDLTPLPVHISRVGGFPAIPAAQSDSIVIGTVKQRAPHFVAGGAATTLTVAIDDIVQQSTSSPITVGQMLTVERFGANVHTASGRTLTYRIQGERMPQENQQYVFFLSREPGKADQILTAYAIKGAKVYPLDDPAVHSSYAQYNGSALDVFLNEVASVRQSHN